MSGSWDWSKPWRDVKRFGEDIYNGMNSWYDSNKKYFPSNRDALAGWGFTAGAGIRMGIQRSGRLIDKYLDDRWDNAHGAERYWMSQIPVWGWTKQLEDKARYYEDYYRHTGYDPKYSQVYGGSAGGLLGDINKQGSALQPKKWARDLEMMFAPQFEENLMK